MPVNKSSLDWSSLIYNMSARHERHECNTSETRTTQVRHECYTNDTSPTRVKNFNFGKNIYSHPYIYYMTTEILQGEEQFNTKNSFLEMSRFPAKIRWESAPRKLNFLMAKAISKSWTLDCSCKCPCTFPHSYAQ